MLVQVESSTQIRVDPIFNRDGVVWPPEPGPLRIVAIDTGTGRINLNPTEGGVVIAMVQADPSSDHSTTVQDNEGLHVYQSTKQIQIAGSGFADNTEASTTAVLHIRVVLYIFFMSDRQGNGRVPSYGTT